MKSSKQVEKQPEKQPEEPQKSQLHKDINKIILDITKASEEKKTTRTEILQEVKEIKFVGSDNKSYSALVIFLPFVYVQNQRNLITKIVNEVQTKKKLVTFVIASRTIIHKKSDFKEKIPRNRTLTSVYDSILEDLISPGLVIGKRSRYHLDGSLVQKIFVSDEYKEALESRVDIITQIYKKLTNRKISIEFRHEICYINKGKEREKKPTKQVKTAKTTKRPAAKNE